MLLKIFRERIRTNIFKIGSVKECILNKYAPFELLYLEEGLNSKFIFRLDLIKRYVEFINLKRSQKRRTVR